MSWSKQVSGHGLQCTAYVSYVPKEGATDTGTFSGEYWDVERDSRNFILDHLEADGYFDESSEEDLVEEETEEEAPF